MKLEEQVLSIEQMNHLKELGLKVKDTALCWFEDDIYTTLSFFEEDLKDCELTLTLHEISNILPKTIKTKRLDVCKLYCDDFCLKYMDKECDYTLHWETGNILDAAYNMLCWILENDYLKQE